MIHEIVDFCIDNGIDVHINKHTIRCSKFDGWDTKIIESFHNGNAKEMKFMHYTPLSEMLDLLKNI